MVHRAKVSGTTPLRLASGWKDVFPWLGGAYVGEIEGPSPAGTFAPGAGPLVAIESYTLPHQRRLRAGVPVWDSGPVQAQPAADLGRLCRTGPAPAANGGAAPRQTALSGSTRSPAMTRSSAGVIPALLFCALANCGN